MLQPLPASLALSVESQRSESEQILGDAGPPLGFCRRGQACGWSKVGFDVAQIKTPRFRL